MKKISILFTILLFCFSFSQKITLSKSGRRFEVSGAEYKMSEYKQQFQNPAAKSYIKDGRGLKTTANILGFAGGILIGAGLPNALSEKNSGIYYNADTGQMIKFKGKKPGWTFVGLGIGLVAVAVPLAIIGNKKVKKGVQAENSFAPKSQNYYQFDFTGDGLALSYNF